MNGQHNKKEGILFRHLLIHTVRRFRHQSCRIYIFDRGFTRYP